MARLLTTPQAVLDYSPRGNLSPDDPALLLCLAAASAWIERRCRRIIAEKAITARHSGSLATHEGKLFLADPETGYACFPVSNVTVQESGTLLPCFDLQTPASPSDGQFAFVNSAAGTLRRGSVVGGAISLQSWERGFANILVTCTAGWTLGDMGIPSTMPEDIQAVAWELTCLILREGIRDGLEQLAQAGADLKFLRLLTLTSKETLDLYTIPIQPKTLAD